MRGRIRGWAGLGRSALAVGWLVLGCSSGAERPPYLPQPSSKPPIERLPPRTDAFQSAPCPSPAVPGRPSECGYLSVPELRADPASKTIRLAVAITYSASRTAQ